MALGGPLLCLCIYIYFYILVKKKYNIREKIKDKLHLHSLDVVGYEVYMIDLTLFWTHIKPFNALDTASLICFEKVRPMSK